LTVLKALLPLIISAMAEVLPESKGFPETSRVSPNSRLQNQAGNEVKLLWLTWILLIPSTQSGSTVSLFQLKSTSVTLTKEAGNIQENNQKEIKKRKESQQKKKKKVQTNFVGHSGEPTVKQGQISHLSWSVKVSGTVEAHTERPP